MPTLLGQTQGVVVFTAAAERGAFDCKNVRAGSRRWRRFYSGEEVKRARYLQPQLVDMQPLVTSCVMSIRSTSGRMLGSGAIGRTFGLTCVRGS